MNNEVEKFDVFIAYYGNQQFGTEKEACILYEAIQGLEIFNGRRLNVYCHPKTNSLGNFEETPRIVARTPLFILVVDKDIPKNQYGQLLERSEDGRLKNLYDEVQTFHSSSMGFKSGNLGNAAKLLICGNYDPKEAEKLDPIFSGTPAFSFSENKDFSSIIKWISDTIVKQEYSVRKNIFLENSRLYKKLLNTDRGKYYASNIRLAFEKLEPELKKIEFVFGKKIDHGIKHTFHILSTLDELIGDNILKMNEIEIAVLIMSSLIHDIGLIVEKEDIDELIKNNGLLGSSINLSNITSNLFFGNQELAVKYIFDKEKENRIKTLVKKYGIYDLFNMRNGEDNYLNDVLNICMIHKNPLEKVVYKYVRDKVVDNQLLDQVYLTVIFYLADILNYDIHGTAMERNIFALDSNMDVFDNVNIPNALISNSESKIRVSTQNHVDACQTCKYALKEIFIQSAGYNELSQKCKYNICFEIFDNLQCRVIEYKDYLQKQLAICKRILHKDKSRYELMIESEVKYFSFDDRTPNHKIDIDYSTTVSLLLGEQIYGNKRVGLREIIQNSIDACKYRKAKMLKKLGYTPTIVIELDKDKNQIRICDNGIGMNRYILENYFLKIGQSFYNSESYKESNHHFKHSGHYGIGFFASFMLSDYVEIHTRHINESESWDVRVSTGGRYASIAKAKTTYEIGTTIILDYGDFKRNFNIYNEKDFDLYNEIKYYIARYFLADISKYSHVEMYIVDVNQENYEDSESDIIPIDSLVNTLGNSKYERIIDLSLYLDEIKCLIRVEDMLDIEWYVYVSDSNGERFEKKDYNIFCNTKAIIYKKIFYNNKNVFLYVPEKYWIRSNDGAFFENPFNYDGIDRQSAFLARTEIIFGNITISDFFDSIGWSFPDLKHPIMAYVGCFYVANISNNVVMYQKKVKIEVKSSTEAATMNGMQYRDSVYVRNVYIPHFHIELPCMPVIVNQKTLPEIKKMVVNIEKEGVYPNIDRNDMPITIKNEISEAIVSAIINWILLEADYGIDMKNLIDTNSIKKNRFIKSI